MVTISIFSTSPADGVLRLIAMIALAWGLPAHGGKVSVESAEVRTPVVELYTSEGCSSCPPADRWISKLGEAIGEELRAVPLAFHVDYWNYLGWEDPFSSSEYTERQRMLGALNRQRSIYTPEFLVSGEETRGTRAVIGAIQSANRQAADVRISMDVDYVTGDGIVADVDILGDFGNATLYLAVFENNIVREIGGGENHGRTLHHDFVVRDFRRLLTGEGEESSARAVIPLDPDWHGPELGLAAMVMDRGSSKTIQAVSTPLARLFPGD